MGSDDDDRYNFFHPNKNRYNLNSKIMITAIISLVAVIILVVILHIYAHFVLRRQARRRAFRIGVLSTQVQSREKPKTGLDETVIASLPLFAFKDMDKPNGNTTIECTVCLSNIEEEELARLLPNCKHAFHVDCIDMWLSSHLTCPICRTPAEPRPQTDSTEPVIGGVPPTAPPMETMNSTTLTGLEGTSSSGGVAAPQSAKAGGGSGSRLSSFRRMLSLDRSSRRIQSCGQGDGVEDVERQ